MKMTPRIFSIIFLLACGPWSEACEASDVVEVIGDAATHWAEQRDGVISGRASMRIYRFANTGDSSLTRAQAIAILDDVSSRQSPESLSAMLVGQPTGSWDGQLRDKRLTLWGEKLRVVFDGPRTKDVFGEKGEKNQFGYDGLNEIIYIYDNNQSNINYRSNLEQFGKASLKFLPLMDYRKVANLFRLAEGPGEDAVLSSTNTEIRFEKTDYFIKNFVNRNDDGFATYEVKQYAPIRVANTDQVFPSMSAVITYGKNEVVSMMTVLLAESLQLNIPIGPPETRCIVPAGTKIFDYRGRIDPSFSSFDEPVDPVERVEQRAGGSDHARPGGTSSYRRAAWIIGINAAVLLVIAAALRITRRARVDVAR